MWLPVHLRLWSWPAHSPLGWLAAGTAAPSMTAASSPSRTPRSNRSKPSTPAPPPRVRSRPRELRLKRPSSASASSRAPSRSPAVARLALALCLTVSLPSCALLRKPEPTQVSVPVVCVQTAMTDRCPAPVYVLPDGAIAADVAAAMAIAESRARDACARQLSELQACVQQHNSAGKRPKGQRR